jgi:hypothetical protein
VADARSKLVPKMQVPDQFADFDSRAIGQRHGSARRTQPDPQNTGRIVGEFIDDIKGTIASNRPTDIGQSSSGQSRETLRSAVTTPTVEAAVSVAMAHRRKKLIELIDRGGQPFVPHCIPPTMRPACRLSLTLGSFGSPESGLMRWCRAAYLPRGCDATRCNDQGSYRSRLDAFS